MIAWLMSIEGLSMLHDRNCLPEAEPQKPSYDEGWIRSTYVPGLVSIIVPTYNRAQLLVGTLDSVYQQTYRPIELIVIDDGSEDNTESLVKSWGLRHTEDQRFRFRYLYQDNQGAPVARNRGLVESHGEYIQFLDADDLLAPTKTQQQMACAARAGEAVAIYGRCREFVVRNGRILVSGPTNATDAESMVGAWLRGQFIPCHAILWPRSAIVALGPWAENLSADQDGEYALRFLLRNGHFQWCPDSHVYYRRGMAGSISLSCTRRSVESHMTVVENVQQYLSDRGTGLSPYRRALWNAYFRVARLACPAHLDVAADCFRHIRKLSPPLSKCPRSIDCAMAWLTSVAMVTLRFWRRTRGELYFRVERELQSIDDLLMVDSGASTC